MQPPTRSGLRRRDRRAGRSVPVRWQPGVRALGAEAAWPGTWRTRRRGTATRTSSWSTTADRAHGAAAARLCSTRATGRGLPPATAGRGAIPYRAPALSRTSRSATGTSRGTTRRSTSHAGAPGTPYWASDAAGFEQVGCVYTAQGFEYDYAGVIIGPDLVWRSDHWVAQPEKSHDSQVKRGTSIAVRSGRPEHL